MTVKASIVTAGSNNYEESAGEVSKILTWFWNPGVPPAGNIGLSTNQKTGDFAVQAQTSPNKTVKVKAGKMIVRATPTGESARLFAVELSADSNVTIADNTTGATRYDKVYLTLPADSLANPPATGDLTEALTLLTERHTAAGEALTATNAIELAEVTVANNFTTIADTAITDKRTRSVHGTSDGWINPNETWTYASATTITVPSGAAFKYSIGDIIKLTQTTVKYFQITAVADALLTVTPWTSETLANATITNNYYLKSSPVGLAQGSWIEVLGGIGFQNSWSNIGGARATVGFMKDTLGFVHLKGSMSGGTSGAIALTLPSGYRPSASLLFPCYSDNGVSQVLGSAGVANTGAVTVAGNNSILSLDGITFKAA